MLVRDVMLRRIGNRCAERGQLPRALLRHDAQRCWKLRALASFVGQLDLLLLSECRRLNFRFKETALAFAVFAEVDDKFEVRPVTITVCSDPEFAFSHDLSLP